MLLCRVLPGKTYDVNPTASRSERASTAIGCKPPPTATGRSSSLIHVAPKQILITSYASNEMDGTKMRMTGRRPDRHAPRSASSLRGIRRCGTLIIIHCPSVLRPLECSETTRASGPDYYLSSETLPLGQNLAPHCVLKHHRV